MNAPRILSRLATTSMRRRPCCATTTAVRSRCSSSSSRRAYGTPSFQSYPLYPNNNAAPPPPRGDGVPESSIAQTDPLPKVNETRPPPSMSSSLSSSHHASTATRDANASASAATTSTTSETTPATAAPTHAKEAAPATTTNTTTTTTTTTTATATTTPPPKVSEQEAQKSKPAARPRPKLRARKAAMKLTPAAVEQLRALLDQPEPKLIKVGVRNRGCSGLAYHLEFVEKPGSFDEEVVQDGVKVLIDSKALFSIIGTEMDWVEDKLSQRFVFKNPNIKEQCGCGESFMV